MWTIISLLNSFLARVGRVLHFLTLVIFVGVFINRRITGHECGRCFSIDLLMVASDRGNVLQTNCSFRTILQPYMGIRRRCMDELTSSTKGSYLLVLTYRFKRTGSGLLNHVGTESPMLERREKANILSWGVALVDVHSKERTECNATGNTVSHCVTGRFARL